ncbi:MFS transporter [Arthrobacter koreensis]|uniref:MFS transporter n=1 Tax=Arthrobacter koreensis TaxID=199136 RepID=UPI002DB60873|nr:MFS transporter [Arthrobacter koreensis]MEB7505471.1 MFS transporter [Arthrobacter koreensis]
MTGTHSLSYLQALRKPRLAAFLAGDLVSRIGDGMTLVALPVIVLGLPSELPAALKLSLVYAVPLAAPLLVSLFFGLGRRRFDPAVTTAADFVLRISFYGLAAALALAGTLSFGWLVALLSAGSVLRSLGSGARRLFALGLAGPEGSYAVNGMIGLSLGAGMFVLGPACGGLLLLWGPAAPALLANAGTYAVLLAALLAVRRSGAETQSRPADQSAAVSGWSILRSKPRILRLFAVLFLYDLFYAPVEIALPLLMLDDLDQPSTALGTIWACYGFGALAGAVAVNYLRRFPPAPVLVGVIAGWALCVAALGLAGTGTAAFVAFAAAGFVYAPFNPLVFVVLQSQLAEHEQQPVFTLWTAGLTAALPLGLAVAGPLVTAFQAWQSLLLSAAVSLALAVAALAVLRNELWPDTGGRPGRRNRRSVPAETKTG